MELESRRFGIAVPAANQNADLPDAFLSSLATKVVQGIDEMYWKSAVNKMRMDERMLEWITPMRGMGIQIKERGATRNEWRWVILRKPEGRATAPVAQAKAAA